MQNAVISPYFIRIGLHFKRLTNYVIMPQLTFSLLALLLFAGCSSFEEGFDERYWFALDDPTLTNDSTLLVGTWEWVFSNSYYTSAGRPVTVTAESSGRSETLVLHADGTAEQYYNGDLYREGEYTIVRSGWSIDLFNSSITQFGVNDVRLVLSTAAMDGPEKVYRRAQ